MEKAYQDWKIRVFDQVQNNDKVLYTCAKGNERNAKENEGRIKFKFGGRHCET